MRELFPDRVDDLPIEAVYADLDWAPRDDRPHVALNMVASIDGRAAVDGSAAGIGSRVDHALMAALRAGADALLFGAGTLRADRVGRGVPTAWEPRRAARGLAPQPVMAVLSASGDLPLERALFAQPERAVVFVAERTPAAATARLRRHAAVIAAGQERPDPREALRVLAERYGVRHVLCEGGPTLNHALVEAGLLDELFVTLAPKLLAGDGVSLLGGPPLMPPVALRLRSLYEHEGELYARYGMSYQQKLTADG